MPVILNVTRCGTQASTARNASSRENFRTNSVHPVAVVVMVEVLLLFSELLNVSRRTVAVP